MQRLDPDAKSSSDVRRMFDAIAPRYDLLNRLLSAGVDGRWRRAAVARALDGFAAADVLDVCCGTGDLAFAFRRDPRARTVVGLDFAPRMVARAVAKRAAGAGAGGFAVADALHLPVASARFDVVSIAFGLRNLVDPAAGVRELARALRPGGRLAVLEFFPREGGWGGGLLRAYFRHVLPRIGRLLSGTGAVDAYRYLPESVEAFATADAVEGWLREAGCRDVRSERFLGGAVGLVVGTTPVGTTPIVAPARRGAAAERARTHATVPAHAFPVHGLPAHD